MSGYSSANVSRHPQTNCLPLRLTVPSNSIRVLPVWLFFVAGGLRIGSRRGTSSRSWTDVGPMFHRGIDRREKTNALARFQGNFLRRIAFQFAFHPFKQSVTRLARHERSPVSIFI